MKTNELIKKQREALGLTLEQVGEYVGVGKSTVRKWESGLIKNMRRDKLSKLADVLQLSPLDLMSDENQTTSQWGDDKANREYLNNKPELLELYNDIVNRDEIYILFDKVRDLDPKDVESVLSVVQTIRNAKGYKD